MFPIDYVLVIIPLLVVLWLGIRTQRYVKGVADFLTAGRVAGRYVVAVASGEAAMGLISVVAMFEMYYTCGFGVSFWQRITGPLGLIFALTGFCIYRYRETRAMTMGQFLEMRYNKSFRIFAAALQSISGVINYAIFPAVGARFLIYFLDLPTHIPVFGFQFPTFALCMMFFLGIAVAIVMFGGQVTIMVTDCIQGILSYPMYVVVVGYILYRFSWSQEMAPVLLDTDPQKSFLNPYDVDKLRNFNLFYVFVGIFSSIFNRMSWSGTQGYNAAAATPHEQKMGGLLGTWRSGFSVMMYTLLAIAAFTYMKHANYKPFAENVSKQLTVKTMSDIVPEPVFAETRKDIENYINDGTISPRLQAAAAEAGYDLVNPEKSKAYTEAFRRRQLRLIDLRFDEDKSVEFKEYLTEGKISPAIREAAVKAGYDIDNPENSTTDKRVFLSEATEIYRDIAKVAINVTAEESPEVTDGDALQRGNSFNTIYNQMLVPMAVREMLPAGITGIFCAIMLFLLISTDTTYMHSWGSIIVQDLILPFRKTAFKPETQLRLLRIIIAGVAAFAFFFSLLFKQGDFILMFFAITGAIWLGGAGPVILFGLYWKRGTTAGAFAALGSGSAIAVGGILCQQLWAAHLYPLLDKASLAVPLTNFLSAVSKPLNPYIVWNTTPDKFPINSQEIFFMAMLVAVSLYVIISLITCRSPFNMDRMLHRGKYRTEGQELAKRKLNMNTIIGIDSQYTIGDKILAWSVFIYSFIYGFVLCFLIVIIWNVFQPWPSKWWADYFYVTSIVVAAIIGIVSTVWFTIGGSLDLHKMFKFLDQRGEVNVLDDGRVIGHVSAADMKDFEDAEHVKNTDAAAADEDEKTGK